MSLRTPRASATRWTLTLVAAALVFEWGWSFRYPLRWNHDNTSMPSFYLKDGVVAFMRFTPEETTSFRQTLGKRAPPPGFSIDDTAWEPSPWKPFLRLTGPQRHDVVLPLWIFIVCAATPAALMWRRSVRERRRWRECHCPTCGYDRAGLPA